MFHSDTAKLKVGFIGLDFRCAPLLKSTTHRPITLLDNVCTRPPSSHLCHLVHKITYILEYLLINFPVLVKPLAAKTGDLNLQTQMYMSSTKVSEVSQIIFWNRSVNLLVHFKYNGVLTFWKVWDTISGQTRRMRTCKTLGGIFYTYREYMWTFPFHSISWRTIGIFHNVCGHRTWSESKEYEGRRNKQQNKKETTQNVRERTQQKRLEAYKKNQDTKYGNAGSL